ncbi:unnamed protein product [Ectocarpus sp. CCAP 1310/34]|nr:unnamed protein product [Ectocarpus sp. CCAP 1310/34]
MSARYNLSEEGKEDSSDEGDHETWSPGKRVSRTRHYSSCILRQALPTTSPIKLRHCQQTSNCNGEPDEEQDSRNDNSTHSNTSEQSTCSGTYSSDEEPASRRKNIWGGDTGATIMAERGQHHGDDGDIALVAAPVHASSPLLSLPGPPSPRSRKQAGKVLGSSAVMNRDHTLSVSSQARDPAPLSPSPQPVAVFRSRNSNYTPTSQPNHHSSTAIHEPRARCGCRGLTVRVDSGPLGLSLEASYRVGETLVLKQAWSDCAADSGMFAHSMLVSNVPGKVDDDQARVLDPWLDGRLSSSGLIKVRAVGLERDHATMTVRTRQGNILNGAPSPPSESRGRVVGVLELDEGDILVRVDNVQPPNASCVGRLVSSPSPKIETEADGCPVAVILRARRQLRSGGMEQWYEAVASRRRLWQRLLRNLSPDSHSDRAKLRKLVVCSRSADGHALKGLVKCKLRNNYQRLISSRKGLRKSSNTDGCNKAKRALAAKVWKDVNRTMSPRRHGARPGFFSASQLGGGGHVCPAHFAGGSKHAVFRVAFATASTLQFVSGMSYMAALVLVQEPVEAMAYATLVTLLQALFPLGDVDLLDAYHLCGGRVVTFRAFGAARSPTPSEAAARGESGDGQYPFPGQGHLRMAEGDTRSKVVSAGSLRKDKATTIRDTDGADRACGWEIGELEEEVVVDEMLPRLVRIFGKALKRRLPALHGHLCKEAVPMSFLCAEWFTTAYARNTPLPLALCALDLFLVRLDDVMIRLGLAILEVLAPSLKTLNGLEILLQYGNLTANVSFQEVLRCALATQVSAEHVFDAQCGMFFAVGEV